jgi:ribosome-associated protein
MSPSGDALEPIRISSGLTLDPAEIEESFVRAAGPGGQHVNKTSTAVELRFDVRASPSLSDAVKARLEALAGGRLNQEGVLVLVAQGSRSQELNRQEVLERLFALIRKAAEPPPPPRRKTRPTLASKQRRLASKSRRSTVKSLRGRPRGEE